MRFKLKILGIVLLILILLLVSLTIVYSISLTINANHPFKAELVAIHEWTGNVNYIGYFIAIVTGLIAFLFPITLTIVNDIISNGPFSSREVSDVVFSSPQYKILYLNVFVLIFYSVQSFFQEFFWQQNLINLILLLFSLYTSFRFIKKLEDVISDFSQLLREIEKAKIEKLLGNG